MPLKLWTMEMLTMMKNITPRNAEKKLSTEPPKPELHSEQQKTLQKRAQNQAAKERLGRHAEIMKEINPEFSKLAKWTEGEWKCGRLVASARR